MLTQADIILMLLPFLLVPLAMATVACCCPTCVIASDDFSVDSLSTDWDQRSGTWAVGSGELSTTDASAVIVHNTTVPAGRTTCVITADVLCATTSDIGRVIGAWVDDNNYWFVEVQPGATDGTLKLFQRTGGSNFQRGSTVAVTGYQANEEVTVRLCLYTIAGTRAIANVTTSTATHIVSFGGTAVTIENTSGGMGTGAGASDVRFDNWTMERHQHEGAGCPNCTDPCGASYVCSTTPVTSTVTVTGFTDGTCGNCTSLNGTWIKATRFATVTSNCQQTTLASGVTCGTQYNWQTSITSSHGSLQNHFINATVANSDTSRGWQLQLDSLTTPIDCIAIGGPHNVPFNAAAPGTITPRCNHDSSDIELTIE